LSLTLKENTISNILLYTHCRDICPKGRALMIMYRVVSQTKRGNCVNDCISVQDAEF